LKKKKGYDCIDMLLLDVFAKLNQVLNGHAFADKTSI
jgi:hypothetical protein